MFSKEKILEISKHIPSGVSTLPITENKNHYPSYVILNSEKWMSKVESPVQTPSKTSLIFTKPPSGFISSQNLMDMNFNLLLKVAEK